MRRSTPLSLSLLLLGLGAGFAAPASAQAPAADPPKATRSKPVAVGEAAPDFSLQDHRGQTVRLSASRGQRPVVLVFYRGSW